MADSILPRSPYDQVDGLVYFARMLDKIRLYAEGKLPEAYHANLGNGFDGRCCHFLGVSYEAIRERTLAGGTDDTVLAWARDAGRRPDAEDVAVWNGFMAKLGWRDDRSERLEHLKQQFGLGERSDIQTLFDLFEADEGRVPR